MKTKEDIKRLKLNWEFDPSWDIEDTDGFEEYREELRAFRLETEAKWKADRENETIRLCEKYHCNRELLKLIQSLEQRIEILESREP